MDDVPTTDEIEKYGIEPKPKEESKPKKPYKEPQFKNYIFTLFIGVAIGCAGAFLSGALTQMNLDPDMMDAVTIGLAGLVFVEFFPLWIIYQYAWGDVWEDLKAALWYKSYAKAAILTPDGRILLKAADIDDEIGDMWKVPIGRNWVEKCLVDGTQLNGPCRMDYGVWSAEGAMSIDMLNKTQSELFATSAYITKTNDLSRAEGFMEAHEANKNQNFGQLLMQNWPIVLGFLVMVGIGLYVMWDKAVTSPAAWQAANTCLSEKANLQAVCARYVDPATLQATAAKVINQTSATGAAVK